MSPIDDDNASRLRKKQREELLVGAVEGLVQREAAAIASRFQGAVEQDDLLSAGRFSLVRAVSLYVHEANTSWESYARHYIRGAMLRVVRTTSRRMRRERAMFRAACRVQTAHRDDFNILDHDDDELKRRLVGFFEAIATVAITTADDADERDPEAQLNHAESAEQLRNALAAALRTMPEGQRKILKLVYVEDYDIEHTAPLLGVHRNTAYIWHTRAIETLRRAVKTLGIREPPPRMGGPLLDFGEASSDPRGAG